MCLVNINVERCPFELGGDHFVLQLGELPLQRPVGGLELGAATAPLVALRLGEFAPQLQLVQVLLLLSAGLLRRDLGMGRVSKG